MKNWTIALILCATCSFYGQKASAQWLELQQLALDIEKLSRMKAMLQEMYKGYQILSNGYNTIKDLAEGNFDLHNTFLNNLLAVNPSVKNYIRVADIIKSQATLTAEYKKAQSQFTQSGVFSTGELHYFTTVYTNLFNKSIDNLDALVKILTNNTLRMSDAERLSAIDRLYIDMQDKISFLRQFNGQAAAVGLRRQQLLRENTTLQNLFGH